MNPGDQGNREYPPCGYGLLGLCCSDCLRGPCRISPFEETQALCGAESDLLVAGNLCRLAAREFVPVLKSFTRAVGEFRKRDETPGSLCITPTRNLARKYGIPEKDLVSFLEKETAKLLDPLAGQPSLIFSSLLPERVFPRRGSGSRCGPLLGELFGLLDWEDDEGVDPEVLLWRALNSAAYPLIVAELTRDILSLLHPPFYKAGQEQEKDGWIIPPDFPDFPRPVLITLAEREYPRSREMQKMAAALSEISGLLSISLCGTKGLIRVGHTLREKWDRSIFDLPMAVLVESPNVLSILAPLTLGLPTVSDPALPIQGSKKAEEFFYSGLSKAMGNFYLPVRDETALSRLSGVLGRKR